MEFTLYSGTEYLDTGQFWETLSSSLISLQYFQNIYDYGYSLGLPEKAG